MLRVTILINILTQRSIVYVLDLPFRLYHYAPRSLLSRRSLVPRIIKGRRAFCQRRSCCVGNFRPLSLLVSFSRMIHGPVRKRALSVRWASPCSTQCESMHCTCTTVYGFALCATESGSAHVFVNTGTDGPLL